MAIVRVASAVVSAISSLLLIRMVYTSEKGLSTTYHRLLLGISIGDVMLSLMIASSQWMMPSDMSYIVWNARGNEVCRILVASKVMQNIAVK